GSMLIVLAVLAAASPAAAVGEPASRIELIHRADELAFDIRRNRQQIIDPRRASPWCGAYSEELPAAVAGADSDLRRGPAGAPREQELLPILRAAGKQAVFDVRSDPGSRR
ncbi:MAG: hypothetical protein MI919_07365, partial [Holophagales bacterium]|nr:hypothetical protein [Holophagales bacterium]